MTLKFKPLFFVFAATVSVLFTVKSFADDISDGSAARQAEICERNWDKKRSTIHRRLNSLIESCTGDARNPRNRERSRVSFYCRLALSRELPTAFSYSVQTYSLNVDSEIFGNKKAGCQTEMKQELGQSWDSTPVCRELAKGNALCEPIQNRLLPGGNAAGNTKK